MRIHNIIYFVASFYILSCEAQDYGKLKRLSVMPSALHENSGIAFIPDSDVLYTINDSGNASSIYGIDIVSGKILTETRLRNTGNDDWEDLTSDKENLYIGDFGNNRNKRKNLTIYWLSNDLISRNNIKKDKISVTRFTLKDQKKFPPKKKNRNFDIESFFVLGDYFYLFTRNRSSKFDGTTKLYKLKRAPGKHKAKLVSTFKTCDDRATCQITSAAIHKPTGKVALLSYDKIWIFQEYPEDNFFNGAILKIPLGHRSQKEAVLFKDENTLIITEEKELSGTGGAIYELSLEN